MQQHYYWKYFIYVLMALYVVFIVASMSIINNLILEGQDYALQTSREARELRTRFDEVENSLPGLLSSSEMRLTDVLRELRRQEQTQAETLRRLENQYEGDEALLANLKKAITAFNASEREAAAKLESNYSYELAAAYFRNTLRPHINAINGILNNIAHDIGARAGEINRAIHNGMNLVILASLFFGSLIVLITILYDRRMNAASRELTYREELFRQLARNIDEVFIIAVNSNDYEYVGTNSSRLLNLQPRELYDKPERLTSFMDESDAAWVRETLDGPALSAPLERSITAPGLDRFLKVRIYSIRVPSTRAQRFIIVLSDQTASTRQQLALSDALKNAHAASAAKSSFLSHMSHEIRTPMNAIIGMTTIALSRINDQARVRDCLGKIAEASRHLLGLINDVLDMSKIESGKLTLNNENFNLKHSLENICNIIRPQIEHKKQILEILPGDVLDENLRGDAMRLNQILLNILSNAIKFTPDGGTITLKLNEVWKKQNTIRIRFTITDTGIGMSQEFLKKLFEPFEQAQKNIAARFGGTGLGMPITANLVTMMGGSINVQSREGSGTTFFLELPFGLSTEEQIQADSLPPLNILIVDDDQGTCEHASLLLEKMGLAPVWTLSGKNAVEMVKKAQEQGKPYDVCLIDWRMPDMGGAETARAIREVAGPDLQIIIISAYDLAPIEDEARTAGVNSFIAKPFFSSTLFDALAGASRKPEAEEQALPDFAGKRILLVEDNEFNREIAQEFLEMVNITVDNAGNGKEAVEKLTGSEPGFYDLILMDVQMPLMNGYEATAAIRASSHADAASIPILAMTANAFSEDVARATASGMNGHLAKPIDVKKLYALIASWLNRNQ